MEMCSHGHLSLAVIFPHPVHTFPRLLWRCDFAREEAVTMTTSTTGIAPPPAQYVSNKSGLCHTVTNFNEVNKWTIKNLLTYITWRNSFGLRYIHYINLHSGRTWGSSYTVWILRANSLLESCDRVKFLLICNSQQYLCKINTVSGISFNKTGTYLSGQLWLNLLHEGEKFAKWLILKMYHCWCIWPPNFHYWQWRSGRRPLWGGIRSFI